MEEEISTKVSVMSAISRLKRQVSFERQPYVKDKIEANSEKLKRCVHHHLNASSARASRNSDNNMLSMRIQKALNKFGGGDGDEDGSSQDDSSAPIVVGSTSGSKSVMRPVRLQAATKIPPYTTWIFLDRNQRMAEDQSVVGRRRIYYGSSGNEALICSDSEDEQLDDEEEKREFSRGDDHVISACVQEHGSSKIVWKTLAECLQAKSSEVEARYKTIIKEVGDTSQENEKFQDLSSAMDSFDNLFCRRCLVFDCRLHGCSQSLVIPGEKQPPSNKQLSPVPCGPSCFHQPRLSTQGSSAATSLKTPPETDAAKLATTSQNVETGPRNATSHPKVTTKRVFIDKGVNVLRKLLKRKSTRPPDEDANGERKKHHGEPSSSETPTPTPKCDQPALLKKLIAKRLVKMKMGSQLNRTRRYPIPTKAKEEDDKQLLGKQLASNWNAFEKGLYETGLQMFGRDSCSIARNLLKDMKTCVEVGEFMQLDRWRPTEETNLPLNGNATLGVTLDGRRLYGRRRGKVRKLKYTWKSVGPSLRKRLDGKEGCKQYTPCSCVSTCGKQCTCTRNGTCCEKYCGCSKTCKNRFRGCHCAKSQCSSRQCPCFAAGRECDPDVCRNCCVGCGDGTLGAPPSQGDSYLCKNMKLLLKQQQRVLLGKSDVAGWGAFLKSPVNKHDYLGEYTGELISHHEADKRGKIYDRENSSFLFNLNDQYVLDACRRGDKLKFANHSPNPNCYAKVIMVAGDHRVGIFANERISAGDELFYDYRYEADRAPPWARKPEDSNKNDEFASGSRRAQKTA